MLDREAAGREATPSGGVIDRQSIKAPYAKERGYDAGRKIVGRKRHIAVDTDDRLLLVRLTPTDISDSAGRQMILNAIRKRWPWEASCYAEPLIREFPKKALSTMNALCALHWFQCIQ